MNKTSKREKSEAASLFSLIFGIIGTVPLYAILFIFNLRLYFLCLFIGFGFAFGYFLIKKEENEIKKEILLIVSAVVVTIITSVCLECIASYQEYMIQCQNMGIVQTYADLLKDIPVHHLLGYYIGLDLLEVGNETLVFNTIVAMWMNIVLSLIFSLIGTQLIKIYLYFDKKFEKKSARIKNKK